MKNSIFVIVAVLVLLLSACGNNPAKRTVASHTIVAPVSYGNGVYYFPCFGEKFAVSLSQFVSDGSRIVAMTGDGNGVYGSDDGYFVVIDTTAVKGGNNADH